MSRLAALISSTHGQVHKPSVQHLPERCVVELMAGARGIATAACRRSALAVSFEISGDAQQDIFSKHNRAWIAEALRFRLVVCLWIGLVCATWSRARRNVS